MDSSCSTRQVSPCSSPSNLDTCHLPSKPAQGRRRELVQTPLVFTLLRHSLPGHQPLACQARAQLILLTNRASLSLASSCLLAGNRETCAPWCT
eukprot:scaffold3759_cov21-Tisochrysis_lutea.AAC.3